MNGTSCEAAQAALIVLGGERLVAGAEGTAGLVIEGAGGHPRGVHAARAEAGAEATAALVIEALGGNPEAFDARVHEARPHAGQAQSAAHLRALLAGSRRLADTASRGGPGGGGGR